MVDVDQLPDTEEGLHAAGWAPVREIVTEWVYQRPIAERTPDSRRTEALETLREHCRAGKLDLLLFREARAGDGDNAERNGKPALRQLLARDNLAASIEMAGDGATLDMIETCWGQVAALRSSLWGSVAAVAVASAAPMPHDTDVRLVTIPRLEELSPRAKAQRFASALAYRHPQWQGQIPETLSTAKIAAELNRLRSAREMVDIVSASDVERLMGRRKG